MEAWTFLETHESAWNEIVSYTRWRAVVF